ncbi:MAG: hypothetical protein HOW71_44905 [Nonomuraea sp.]|nr:hypothetical protein [Nonomuraea sp.]NUQ95874.1 hypothetical protein [Streptomyces sp.]NUS15504.1 hypothetical protein [Streptomyces sp.]NUS24037.1 hypothetical protein [Streptomyces sp.]
MTEQTIGEQLDHLGLTVDLEDGERVLEATVTLVTGDGNGLMQHRPIKLPATRPGSIHVPHPVERRIVTVVAEDQEISDEQRRRVCTWLTANGIDPAVVAGSEITLECKMFGARKGRQFIGFHQYHLEDGKKVHAAIINDAVKFHRYVEQTVELGPDPAWEGWETYDARIAERTRTSDGDAG